MRSTLYRTFCVLTLVVALNALGCCCHNSRRCCNDDSYYQRDCGCNCESDCTPAVPHLQTPYPSSAPYPQAPYPQAPYQQRTYPTGTTNPISPISVPGQERVHVFLVNGLDFIGCGKFHGLAEYLKCSGYANTRYSEVYNSGDFLTEICDAWQKDPDAKIVLVGFSAGGYAVNGLAHDLKQRDIPVALLVYMAADFFRDRPMVWPSNAERLLHIYGDSLVPLTGDTFRSEPIKGARNLVVATPHIAVPKHRDSIRALTEELQNVLNDAEPVAVVE